jgi:hypothetical protein
MARNLKAFYEVAAPGNPPTRTELELGVHMTEWRKRGRPGFNVSPLDEQREINRWMCQRLDEMRREGKVDGG